MATRYVGTDDLVGATVTSVDYNEMSLEKDGRKFVLTLEYDSYYNTMCDNHCGCSDAPAYFRAEEVL